MQQQLRKKIAVKLFYRYSKSKIDSFGFWFLFPVSLIIPIFLCYNSFALNYTLSMTTSGAQNINVSPHAGSNTSTAISEDQISVSTSCRYGYDLVVGTTVSDNNLYLNGSNNNNQSGTYLSPTSGSTALINSTNAWGYYYNANPALATPTASSTFMPVPAFGSTAATIKTALSSPSASDISDNFSVYYGVSIEPTFNPGTYTMVPDENDSTGAIIYYLTLANDCLPYIVHFNPTSTSTGSSISGTGTMVDQEMYKDVLTTLSLNSFTAPAGYEFKEWNTAQDGSGTSFEDGDEITNLTLPGSDITLYAIWERLSLYSMIADLSRGTLADNSISLSDAITTPTSTDKNADTSNSGVFTYDSDTYGVASDTSNNYQIYFYRGILETNPGNNGSLGSANAYPNYVKLNNTCWRIVRTTGSGGVKMIYNGGWNSNTCANTTANTRIATSYYAGTSSTIARRIALAGYTYNSYGTSNSNTSISVNLIFGSSDDASFSSNTNDSRIKTAVDSWYNNNLSDYTSILELNAGFCNDRSTFTSAAGTTALTSTKPNANNTSTYVAYFGAYSRNGYNSATRIPSLSCSRGIADIYSANTANGGNGQLGVPAALITADELSFAGSGSATANQGSASNSKSFINSGEAFWTMTPHSRTSTNSRATHVYYLNNTGSLAGNSVYTSQDVRPVISLKEGTEVISGTGTAVDPWVVMAP